MEYDSSLFPSLDLEVLVGMLATAKDQQRELNKYRRDVELEVERRMKNNRQAVLETDLGGRSCRISFENQWDYDHLHRLKEYMSASEWDALLNKPKPPPARQPNASKCEAFARRSGGEARAIVDEARSRFNKKLRVEISQHIPKEVAL
jgi:hypothetical protein